MHWMRFEMPSEYVEGLTFRQNVELESCGAVWFGRGGLECQTITTR